MIRTVNGSKIIPKTLRVSKGFHTYRNISKMLTSVADRDILIIEDSIAQAGVISDFLKTLNYKEIHACYDGKSGIKKFLELSSSNRLPLVFLDYYLPDMDAVPLFEELIKAQPKTKVIINSVARKDEAGISYLIQHGAYHFLQKPFSFEDLKEVMETFEKEQSALGK